jgi:hypothetical protein
MDSRHIVYEVYHIGTPIRPLGDILMNVVEFLRSPTSLKKVQTRSSHILETVVDMRCDLFTFPVWSPG